MLVALACRAFALRIRRLAFGVSAFLCSSLTRQASRFGALGWAAAALDGNGSACFWMRGLCRYSFGASVDLGRPLAWASPQAISKTKNESTHHVMFPRIACQMFGSIHVQSCHVSVVPTLTFRALYEPNALFRFDTCMGVAKLRVIIQYTCRAPERQIRTTLFRRLEGNIVLNWRFVAR